MRGLLLACALAALGPAGAKPLEPCPSSCRCFLSEGLKRADCRHVPEWADKQSDAQDVRILPPPAARGARSSALHLTHFEVFPRALQLAVTNRSIVEVIPSGFHGLQELQQLDLSNNLLSRFNYRVFLRMPALRRLVLAGNPLALESGVPLLASRSLLSLDLSHCDIVEVPRGALDGLRNLTALSLRGNPLQLRQGRPLLGPRGARSALTELDLSACELEAIPAGVLDGLAGLRRLYLDGNNLVVVAKGVLPRGLHHLDLSGNAIQDAPTAVISSLRNLTKLELSDNPITCTCSLIGLQGWLSRQLVVTERPVVCAGPAEYRGKSWDKVDELALCREEERQANSTSDSSSPDESASPEDGSESSSSSESLPDDLYDDDSRELSPASYEVYTHENVIGDHPPSALPLKVLKLSRVDMAPRVLSHNDISFQADQPYDPTTAPSEEAAESTTEVSESKQASVEEDDSAASVLDEGEQGENEATEKDAETFMSNADTINMGKSMPLEHAEEHLATNTAATSEPPQGQSAATHEAEPEDLTEALSTEGSDLGVDVVSTQTPSEGAGQHAEPDAAAAGSEDGTAAIVPGSEDGTAAVVPGSEDGTTAAVPGSEDGTAAAVPGSEDGTAAIVPGSEDGTAAVVPGSEDGTTAAVPGSEDGTTAAVPGSEDGTAAVVPGSEDGAAAAVPGSEDGTAATPATTASSADIDVLSVATLGSDRSEHGRALENLNEGGNPEDGHSVEGPGEEVLPGGDASTEGTERPAGHLGEANSGEDAVTPEGAVAGVATAPTATPVVEEEIVPVKAKSVNVEESTQMPPAGTQLAPGTAVAEQQPAPDTPIITAEPPAATVPAADLSPEPIEQEVPSVPELEPRPESAESGAPVAPGDSETLGVLPPGDKHSEGLGVEPGEDADAEVRKSAITYAILGCVAVAMVALMLYAVLQSKAKKAKLSNGKAAAVRIRHENGQDRGHAANLESSPDGHQEGTELKDMTNPLLGTAQPEAETGRRASLASLRQIREEDDESSRLRPSADNVDPGLPVGAKGTAASEAARAGEAARAKGGKGNGKGNGKANGKAVPSSRTDATPAASTTALTSPGQQRANGQPQQPSKVTVKAGVIATPMPRTPVLVNRANGVDGSPPKVNGVKRNA